MCPGEVRLLKVPPTLAVPTLAVGLLDPPTKAPWEWRVELTSIDGIIRNNNNEMTDPRGAKHGRNGSIYFASLARK